MRQDQSRMWRLFLVIAGVLYLAGGSQHPQGGGMAAMLADPAWLPGHATSLLGLLALVVGLVMFRRSRPPSHSTARWLQFAIVASVLEVFEMAVHTMAYVDANALANGQSTPVLTTHLRLATVIYPIFGAAMLGLLWVGLRERSLGSPWINWIGMIGAIAHGSVMLLVYTFEISGADVLFPVAAIALSLWFILAGLWPLRSAALHEASASDLVGAA